MISARQNTRDRWLLSYADLITLVFAVFVLLYAQSRARERTAANTLMKKPPAPVSQPVKAPSSLLRDLSKTLAPEQTSGLLRFSTEPRGVTISLNDGVCFRPGESDIEPAAAAAFVKIAEILSKYNNRILLEGHTDSRPILNSRFRSNWELSTARSISVMQLMEQASAMPPERFSIGGAADNTPKSTNDNEAGRAQNRRVDIIVLESNSPGPAIEADAFTRERAAQL